MKDLVVKDYMVSMEEYATVYEDETLYKAVLALEQAQEEYLQKREGTVYPHRALLVLNRFHKVVGKLSQLDVLKALEPKYQELISRDDLAKTAASGFSLDFLQNMLDHYHLFDQPLRDLCRKAAGIKVKDCMYAPSEDEVVTEQDNLDVAIHQLIVGKHQSLLVMNNSDITGILRLTDVFCEVCSEMKKCGL